MQSAPLEILEIVSYVASHVRKRDLTAGALVSKTWYQAFNPFIWHSINWKHGRQVLPKHTQFVRAFRIGDDINKERNRVLDLRFPNLVSLDMG
ncbi:hypothetical protein BGZ65_012878, partial [Modicella reniformis]